MNNKFFKNRRNFLISRVSLSAVLFGIISTGCSGGSLGNFEPFDPLVEARYKADAAARSIGELKKTKKVKSENTGENSIEGNKNIIKKDIIKVTEEIEVFENNDDKNTYIVGQLLYNNAYIYTNEVLEKVIIALQVKGSLPDNQSDLKENIKKSIDAAITLQSFAEEKLCDKTPERRRLCKTYGLPMIPINQLLLSAPDAIAEKAFDAVIDFIEKSRDLRENRRKELVKQLDALKLKPFRDIASSGSKSK